MTIYIHKNWCGVGDRIVCHPRGKPVGYFIETCPRTEDVLVKLRSLYGQAYIASPAHRLAAGLKAVLPLTLHSNLVYHLDPDTLDLLEVFPVR